MGHIYFINHTINSITETERNIINQVFAPLRIVTMTNVWKSHEFLITTQHSAVQIM